MQKSPALRKILSLMLVVGFTAVVFGQACSDMAGQQFENGMNDQGSLANFKLNPANASVAPSASVQLSPSGGSPPYTYVVASGNGSVSSNGLYTAPAAVSLTSASAMVMCTDSLGTQAWSQITITGSGMSASYSPNPAPTSTAIQITVVGGTPPYRYQVIQGAGQMNQNFYSSPATAETAVISIVDAAGVQMQPSLQITVGGGAGGGGGGGGGTSHTGILQIWASQPNQRIAGGPGCPAGYYTAGTITDMGGGIGNMQGDQTFCYQSGTAAAGEGYISSMYVTAGNHTNAGCAQGYTQVAGWPDCGGGLVCWGNQFLCAKFSTGGEEPLTNFYITGQPYRNQACNGGDINIGSTADCYWNQCNGVQNFCVR